MRFISASFGTEAQKSELWRKESSPLNVHQLRKFSLHMCCLTCWVFPEFSALQIYLSFSLKIIVDLCWIHKEGEYIINVNKQITQSTGVTQRIHLSYLHWVLMSRNKEIPYVADIITRADFRFTASREASMAGACGQDMLNIAHYWWLGVTPTFCVSLHFHLYWYLCMSLQFFHYIETKLWLLSVCSQTAEGHAARRGAGCN